MIVKIPTYNLLMQLVGKIKGFYLEGLVYEHEEGLGYIEGRDLLTEVLYSLPSVKSFKIIHNATSIDIDEEFARELLISKKIRPVDFTLDDTIKEIKNNPDGYLGGIKLLYNNEISLDFSQYFIENVPLFYNDDELN